ncbi:MAG TPA: peptidylprolyl isomerase, partial [Cyclobacteriaceae bacterium]|nr:peptidylprolyl isomerase [Cyclobacteriaceae bacterium]
LIAGCGQTKTDKDYVVTIHTKYGDMIAVLFDETPKHRENFIKLVNDHFYDSLLFHRVVKGFMIQGGDPLSRHAPSYMMLGMGGPAYTIDAEFNSKYIHERGALAAARIGDSKNPTKASNGSQFYIVQGSVIPEDQAENIKINMVTGEEAFKKYGEDPAHKPVIDSLKRFLEQGDAQSHRNLLMKVIPDVEKTTGLKVLKDYTPEMIKTYTTAGGTPSLDMEYTVFGKVIKGLDVIDSIAQQPTHLEDRPLTDIHMTVTVEEMSREAISKEYGYVYPTK